MKILLINQTFYPDVVATSQYLTQLALCLKKAGHDVCVLAGRMGYDDPSKKYPARESYQGIQIFRIPYFSGGKETPLTRFLNFASFHLTLFWRLLLMQRQDAVVALTSPPLVAATAGLFCRLKGGRLVYWVMDLNPDEAVAAGWLRENSLAERTLTVFGRLAFQSSAKVVALDRFMKERIVRRYGVPENKIEVVTPWACSEALSSVPHAENAFRKEMKWDGKFVIMYSGNHSPCHPLDTLLEAAARLRDEKDFLFCFIGGGSLVKSVKEFRDSRGLKNIVQLPYQPFARLNESLSAADVHVAVMGERFVGILHPSKIYGILAVGQPFVYIGPSESDMGDLVKASGLGWQVRHGDVESLIRAIRLVRDLSDAERSQRQAKSAEWAKEHYSQARLCRRMANLIENAGKV